MRFAISPEGITIILLQRGVIWRRPKPTASRALSLESLSRVLMTGMKPLSYQMTGVREQVAIQAQDDITSPAMGLTG